MSTRFYTIAGFILGAAALRLIPHPPNFTPVGAMALFGGAFFANRALAFVVPLVAMLLSDSLLALVLYGSSAFSMIPFVYGGFTLTVCLGLMIRRRRSLLPIAAATLVGSVLFFLLTNLGVWLRGTLYPLTWEGLITCYVAAIPFFRNTVLGNAFYALVLFGGFAIAQHKIPALREKPLSEFSSR